MEIKLKLLILLTMNSLPIWVYVIIAFFIFDFFLVLFIFVKRGREKSLRAEELQYIKSHWIRIIDMAVGNMKQSILDSDKLLDYALNRHGFDGSLGEKLKKSGSRFSDLSGVWSAHKLRNKVAHELGDINKGEAQRALKHFKRALNDLGAGL